MLKLCTYGLNGLILNGIVSIKVDFNNKNGILMRHKRRRLRI